MMGTLAGVDVEKLWKDFVSLVLSSSILAEADRGRKQKLKVLSPHAWVPAPRRKGMDGDS